MKKLAAPSITAAAVAAVVGMTTSLVTTPGEKFILRNLITGESYPVELVPMEDETPEHPAPPPTGVLLPTIEGSHGVPDFAAFANFKSVRSGEATDPATWGGFVPGPDDVALIQTGHDVTLTENLTCRVLAVDGKFIQADESVLQVKELFGRPDSHIHWSPGAEIVVRDIPIDKDADPNEWGTGVVILGKITADGRYKDPYAESIDDIPIGATTITLRGPPEGWLVGDEIVLPRTEQYRGQPTGTGNERRHITAIDGETITLDEPASLAHPAVRNPVTGEIARHPVIINLTRDIIVRSENGRGTRGHFVKPGHADSDLCGVQFVSMSRTLARGFGDVTKGAKSQVARYAVHWHHNHSVNPFRFRGCSIDLGDESYGMILRFGVSIHQTHDGFFENNALWGRAVEGLLATEDGHENRNTIRGNVFGGSSVGLWLWGPRNYVDLNLAVACTRGYEVGYETDGQATREFTGNVTYPTEPNNPHGPSVTRRLSDLSFLSFDGNAAVSCGDAMLLWNVGDRWPTDRETGVPFFNPDAEVNRITDFFAGHCGYCSTDYYVSYVEWIDPVVITDPSVTYSVDPSGKREPIYGFQLGTRECRKVRHERPVVLGPTWGYFMRQTGIHSETLLIQPTLASRYECVHKEQWAKGTPTDTYLIEPTFLKLRDYPEGKKIVMKVNHNFLHVQHDAVWLKRDEVVERVYFDEQLPDYVLPRKDFIPSEIAGLTNSQAWATEPPRAVAGAVVPVDAHREFGIDGWVAPVPSEKIPPLLAP